MGVRQTHAPHASQTRASAGGLAAVTRPVLIEPGVSGRRHGVTATHFRPFATPDLPKVNLAETQGEPSGFWCWGFWLTFARDQSIIADRSGWQSRVCRVMSGTFDGAWHFFTRFLAQDSRDLFPATL